ncbi:MAG TPA: tetratricopeptide repeat protein [Pyrinomonadaceae bacterium]|nr:tetratricopeptide repeat protein [Pyrinomonadaceae bacterium]
MIISENHLQEVRQLHEKGLHLQAFKLANLVCPLAEWEGTEAILLASHVAFQLGAVKTSENWVKKAWRKDKKHAHALFYRAADISHGRGAIPTLVFLNKYGSDFQGDKKIRAWWYSLHAQVFAQLRDFKTADLWHEKAIKTAPEESWIWVSKSHTLEQQDRYDESLEMARKAYSIEKLNRVTVSQLAHILTLLEQYDEAFSILNHTSNELENCWITRQLADLQTELGLHKEAFSSFEKMFELSPMREEEFENYLHAGMSDAAYMNGDIQKAIEFAEKSKSPFHLKIKENLEKLKGEEKRVQLKLGFIRQHHLTCAPATLSNIARFWQKKAEHLELANEMCYEGTPAYKERIWASENGWETCEFTVNWENTVDLINRGVPFTLATIHPGGGHLQAIVGYDERRKTILVRDPYYQRFDEFLAEELLENQRSSGPRGLALVPKEKAELLQGLELKESRHYDYLFGVDSALEKHNREQALQTLESMEKEFPDHRLTWSARWALAAYDSNTPKLLKAVEALLKQFPDDVNLKMSFLSISQEFSSRGERLKKLEEFSTNKKTDPLFWQMFGYELGQDANSHRRAFHWLYKSLRKIPNHGTTIRIMADILWSKRQFEDSSKLYWFASCLHDKDEQFSFSYFLAARFLKKEDEAIKYLSDRFERFGHQSNLPVRSLFYALRESGRMIEAFEVLEKALEKRTDDGELKLFVAEAKARFGKKNEAEKLLKEAENQAPRTVWLINAALISELQGNLQESLEYWKDVVKIEPSSLEAHDAIANLLLRLEGKASSQIYLRKVSREFPFNRNLQKLRLGYLTENLTEAIAVLRDLVRLNPKDAWSQRELAVWLCRVKKYEKALEAAQTAIQIDPNETVSHSVLGFVLAQTGKKEEAVLAFKKALNLYIDNVFAFFEWLKLCRTNQEKIEVLKFTRRQLSSQANFGEGVTAYRDQAKRLLEPETLLDELKKLQTENKNAWFISSALVQQLVDMHKLSEALELAEQNTQKFPLIHQVWFDLSLIHRLKGENDAEINALKQAIAVNSSWSFGFQRLCEAFERSGRFAEAETSLREALIRMPNDHFLLGYLAGVLWKLNKKVEALNTVRQAVSIQPDYDWAWEMIKTWGIELNQPDLAAELGRELTIKKPKDVNSWLRYAQNLDKGIYSQTQLEAIEEGLKLEPANELGLALKANALSDARRYDEAIAICQTFNEDGHQPERLKFVQSGIEANRGNFPKAIQTLEDLAKSSPDYYPAWERLAIFYRQSEDAKDDYLRVTEEMARLAPQDATVFGYLGEAYLQIDQREKAKKAFHQAFTIAPEYGFAGYSLFDLYFEDDDKDNCRNVLQLLDAFVKEDNTLIRKIALSVKEKEPEQTKKLWQELCLSEKAHHPQFDYVLKQFKENNYFKEDFVWQTLQDSSSYTTANPLIGHYLIERTWNTKGEKVCLQLLEKLEKNEKVWAEAVRKFLEILLETNPETLREFISKNYAKLKKTNETWATTGYCLNVLKNHLNAKDWFSDWQNRENVEAWMLWNYSIVLRRLKQNNEAQTINQKALEVKPDDSVNQHLMMLGLEELNGGNFEKANEIFAQINPRTMSQWDNLFYTLLSDSLEIYQRKQNGEIEEVHLLTENLINNYLGLPNLWKDEIISHFFEKNVKVLLGLCEGNWLKFKLRTKIFLSRHLSR